MTDDELSHFRNCEAREWVKRYRAYAYEHGHYKARTWWESTITEIERKRGLPAADELRARMNFERHDTKRK